MTRRKKKSIFSTILVFILLISLRTTSFPAFAGVGSIRLAKSTSMLKSLANSAEYIPPQEGLELTKTASVYGSPDADGRQIFKIDLKAEATSNIVITKKPADIILILDNSSSLNGNTDDVIKTTRQDALIAAATNFVNDVAEYSEDSKVAVVNAKNNATTATVLLNVNVNAEKQKIIDSIKGLTTQGDSVVEQGLESAFNIYNGVAYDPNRARIVILVTGATAGGTVMADSIQWSAILKGSHSNLIDPSNILFGNNDGTAGYPSPAYGCGATIYSIGVFSSTNNPGTNEYLWRISSNSLNGAAAAGEEYMPNGPNSYYLTTNKASGLDAIFEGISEQLGTTLKNAVVKDYIDPRFDIVDANGNILQVGSTITADGKIGTIKQDGSGIYVEWPPQEIAPQSADGKVPAKIFAGTIYLKPKIDFIGGNNIPTNMRNISAVYADGINIGSFQNPLVNVPFKLTIENIKDYILLGERIPRNKETAQNDMVTESLNNVSYEYPAGMLSFAWNPVYTADTKPETTINYNLTIEAAPIDYILNPDPAFYNAAVGNPAAQMSKTGVYTISPVNPNFAGSTYNIFLGETAGDDGAGAISNAITLSIPDKDISGEAIPPKIKTALEGRLAAYKDNITFNVTSKTPADSPDYTDPLSNYAPTENTTLYAAAVYDSLIVGKDIPVVINVKKGTLTITKTITGTPNPNQTFVFEIKEYKDVNKMTLVKTFYETIRTEGTSGMRKVISLPKGYYEVKEKSDWSWQYNLTTAQTVSDTLGMSMDSTRDITKVNAGTSFTNASKLIKWLTSIDWVINKFTGGEN